MSGRLVDSRHVREDPDESRCSCYLLDEGDEREADCPVHGGEPQPPEWMIDRYRGVDWDEQC